MPDEPTGQPAQVVPPADVAVPTTPPAPETQPATPQAPPAGRSVEEVLSELQEAKSLIQQANERAARAEHEAQYTRNLIEQFGKGKTAQEPVPAVPDVSDDEFLTNPAKATTKIIQAFREQDRQERERKEREQYVERAKSQFETGRKQATTQLGKLAQGIENEIASEIQQGIISGAIHPDAATDPDLWAVTALAYRYKVRGERNFDRYFSSGHTAMAPVHQETPTASTPPRAEMTLSPEQEELISRAGITREQFIEAMKKERGISETRAR